MKTWEFIESAWDCIEPIIFQNKKCLKDISHPKYCYSVLLKLITVSKFFLFFKCFIYPWETQRERDIGRGRSRLPMGSHLWDLISGPQDHDLSQKQILNHWATPVSQNSNILEANWINHFQLSCLGKWL